MRIATWRRLDGAEAVDIAAAKPDDLWCIGEDGQPRRWNGTAWQLQVQDLTEKLTRISVDERGDPFALGETHTWWFAAGRWIAIGAQTGVDIAAFAGESRWVVSDVDDPNQGGKQIAFNGEFVGSGLRVAAGPDSGYYVNAENRIYQAPVDDPRWTVEELAAPGETVNDIAFGLDGSLWIALDHGFRLWNGTAWQNGDDLFQWFPNPDQPFPVAPTIESISAFTDGRPVLRLSDGTVWELRWKYQSRVAITPATPDAESVLAFRVAYHGKSIGQVMVAQGTRTTKADEDREKADPEHAPYHFVMRSILEVSTQAIPTAALLVHGAHHFNSYQVILVDSGPDGTPNQTPAGFGAQAVAPYIDPPRGGFPPDPADTKDEGVWSDNFPWYLDEIMPDDAYDCEMMPWGNQLSARKVRFDDDPHLNGGGELQFRTWIVAIAPNSSPICFLGGLEWECRGNDQGGRDAKIKGPSPFDYPSVHDFEYLLFQPPIPNGPSWSDPDPTHLQPPYRHA